MLQNIVNFVGACWGEDLTCLVLEWVPKGSLQQLLHIKVGPWLIAVSRGALVGACWCSLMLVGACWCSLVLVGAC
jgi:hypothetical protein